MKCGNSHLSARGGVGYLLIVAYKGGVFMTKNVLNVILERPLMV